MIIKDFKEMAKQSEERYANSTAIVCQIILVTIIAVAYFAEMIKGHRGIPYTIATFALCYGPVAASIICFKLNPQKDTAMRRVMGIGFALLYTFLLFTASNDLVFTYVFPMFLILMIYMNLSFVIIIGSGAILENLIYILIQLIVHKRFGENDIVTFEIQFFLVIISVVFFILVNIHYKKSSDIKAARVVVEKDKISGILDEIVGISKNVTDNAHRVDDKMEALSSSMEQTLISMSEVSAGTNESAEAIQNQLLKTELIQDSIETVGKVVENITEDMEKAGRAVEAGKKQINNLTKLSEEADKAGNEVAQALEAFTEYTNKMNSITELINNVASQTSLLALNASIEAARAGDAGKGFAVVASEISNLAGQTTDATANINDLIENITEQLSTMVDKIDLFVETNKQQGITAGKTVESFTEITDNIAEIKEQATDLESTVSQLTVANKEIVDSIQTISAITEEVSAHSGETYSSSEMNQDILGEVGNLVEQLNIAAQQLSNTTH